MVYSNGVPSGRCKIMGTVIPVRTDAFDICGGEIEYLWEKTDSCGRSISYSQVLFVDPAPEAVWIDAPSDMTLPLGQTVAADYMPLLFYSNGAPVGSFCEIAGSVLPTRSDMIVECEGTTTFTWEITDDCGRPLAHSQVFTLSPPDLPAWINPPGDRTEESCSGFDFDALPPLFFSNGQSGPGCGIVGSVVPTRDGSVTDCQGSYIYTWMFTDNCNRTITHSRTVTVVPPPAPSFVNPPADLTVSCENEPSSAAKDLNYTNGGTNMCLITGFVSAIPMVVENPDCSKVYTYMWEFTDFCNRYITHTQVVNVDPPLQAQWINPLDDITVESCSGFDFNELPPLFYNNNQTLNGCGIAGSVPATRTGDAPDCNGAYIYMWEFMDDCGRTITHSRTVTVVPPPAAAFVNPPASETVSCENAPDETTPIVLSYTNNGVIPCLIAGDVSATPTVQENPDCSKVLTYLWEYTDNCNRPITHTKVVNVDPPLVAQWINPPANTTVQSCDDFDFDELPDLFYNNNQTLNGCGIMGSVPAVRSGDVTDCQGVYTYTWEFTDDCGRLITHTRTVTVVPPPAAAFVNPPASETVSCENAPDETAPIVLSYTNNGVIPCLIAGDVSATPTVQENPDCSKVLTYLWEYTDNCNRPITHTKVVNVDPPLIAQWINPPANTTVQSCDDFDFDELPDLFYNNNQTLNGCGIMGSVPAVRSGDVTDCQGVYTYTWEFTDDCGRPITHTRTVTVVPPPAAAFVNPPASETVSCENAPDETAPIVLSYTNNGVIPCLIAGDISATPTVQENPDCSKVLTYLWEFTDDCDRPITHTKVVNVLPPPVATFTNPPPDATFTCINAPDLTTPQLLTYNNGLAGDCQITGTVEATVTPNIVNCQGTYTLVWEHLDNCGRTIRWTQVITVQPPVEASFVNPPLAVSTVSCENEPDPNVLPTLNVSNNSSGACLIEDLVVPKLDVVVNNCAKTYTYTWDFTDFCNRPITYTQVINVLPPAVATFTDAPVYTTMTCEEAGLFNAPDINYSNNSACPISGSLSPVVTSNFTSCGGNIQISWTGVDDCNRPLSYNQIIIVSPAPNPVITSAVPDDVTVSCQDLSSFAIPLDYSNGQDKPCGREGIMAPVLNASNVTLCGGIATINWEIRDECGYTLRADQTITVLPAPQAEFQNLPAPTVTVACTDVPPIPPTLNYSNGEPGFCSIDGFVSPIITGGFTSCGGTIQYTWQFTDDCGRPIVYNQNVIVEPADEPFFTTDPIDELLPCLQGFTPPPPLNYTNGLAAPCAITGSVSATTQDLGTSRIYTWTYRNACTGNEITADQEVSIRPVPNIVADRTSIDICYGEYFELSDIIVTDLNNTNITLTYHTGTPATVFNEIGSTLITSDVFSTYYILATNDYGCTDEVAIRFNNVFGPQAGLGQMVTICNDGRTLNLWDYLTQPYDNNGYWSDTYGTGLNISDPMRVSFAGQVAGNYPFDYIVTSTNLCPDAVATVQVELVDPGDYDLLEIACSPDFQTYTVKIEIFGYTLTTSAGTIANNGSIKTISGIPITQNVTLTLKSTLGDCADEMVTLNPPQCNCPVIPAPVSLGNQKACQNQVGVNLSVTVSTGLSAQWFSALSGGTLLQDQSLTYAPPTTTVGITTYYVQAFDPLNGCFSVRIPVIFEVQPNPVAKDIVLEQCDDNRDGIVGFDLSTANPLLITGGGYTFSYYLTLTDAQNELNALPTNYTNTVNNQIIFALVKNTNGCKDIAEVTLRVLPIPTVTFTVKNESCFGIEDGSITVNPPLTGLEFKLNNLPWTTNGVFGNLKPGTYTVQVRDAESCIASYPHVIAPGQKLSFAAFSITCNNSGTLSNANDDLYNIVLNVSADPVSSNTYTVRYNNVVVGSTYTLGIVSNFSLPADGSSGVLEVTDNVTGCKISRDIGPLTSCSTDCDISISNLQVECDNKNTDSDATDDIYTISFTANIVNGGASTSFTLLINNVISGTYNYGEPVSFQLAANANAPDIKIRDFLNIQCITNIPVGSLSGCSGACSISAIVTNINCNDNSTINDPNDDKFTFTIRVNGFNISDGWQIAGNPTVYAYNTDIILGPYPISGGNLSLNIRDRVDSQCTKIVPIIAPAPCSTPCVLQVNNVIINACDNNNTGNTTADDKFSVTFVVNVVSGSTNFYNVTYGTQTFGPFTYGQTATINNLPANGQNLVLTVKDAINSGCVQTFTVKQDPCSSCTQTVDAGQDIQLTCAQNTATLTGTASVSGGIFVWTGPNGFNKTGQTVTTSTEGTYTLTVTFPDQCVATDMVSVATDANLPISNAGPNQELTCIKTTAQLTASSNLTTNVTYTWTNAAGVVIGNTPTITVNSIGFYYVEVTNTTNNCKSGKDEVEVFNLNQQLTFNTKIWNCDDKNTPTTGADDEYTITFNLANTTNATNQYRILYQGSEIGLYNYNQNVPLVVPADGNMRLYEFVDLVTGCKTSTEVGPFISCSTNCLIEFTTPLVDCDDNGTESIDTDDKYTIKFNVSALNGGLSGSFRVTIDGVLYNTYTYGSTVEINLPALSNTPFIQLQDQNIAACQAVVPVPTLKPCSSTCTISAQVSNILCNDNGTINDPSDDVFSFDVIVDGLNTSAGWKVFGSSTVNAYNARITFGPYPISGGTITLNLVDNTSANCTAVVTAIPPAVCSEPCVLAMSGLQILDCNNNNTGPNTEDDYFSVRFVVNRVSGSAVNYGVSDGVNTYGPFIYGELVTIDNLPANGRDITLKVTDPTNSGCTTQFIVNKQPCSTCAQTADAGADQLITCQNNVVTLTGSATPGGTFVWTGPSSFNKIGTSVTTSTPGMYYLTVTYPDLCQAKDSALVSKDASVPDAIAGPDQVINCLVSQVQVTGSTTFVGSVNLIWTDSNGIQIGTGSTVSITNPGTYYFEVINPATNCSSGKDEVIVIEDKDIPEAKIIADPGNLLDCIIGTITLSGKPIADVIFNWQTGESFISNQPSIVIKKDGIVTMTAIDTINGCENKAIIEIIDLQDYPILLTTPAKPITCANNGVYISAGESPEGPNLVFTWLDASNLVIAGETNDSLYVVSPGTYYVMLTDTLNGCSNRDTFVVDRIGDFPQVTVPADITLYCGANTTALVANIINPTASTSLTWSTNSGNILSPVNQSNINVKGEGDYTIQVVYPATGCITTESVSVTVNDDYPTQVLTTVNDETCKDEKDGSINISSVSGGTPPLTYRLNGNIVNGNVVISPLAAGSYAVQVTDANGCKFDTTFIVKSGIDINLFATSPIELVYNQSQIIELITNLQPSEIASIKWTPTDNLSCDNCLVTSLIAKENITYKVEITDINGCSESVSITIRVRDNVIITTPNIINPGSGSNKFFTVYGNESVINIEKMSIYDRWGNQVFIKENFKPNIPSEGWDGTFKGQDVVPGVFVFLVEYRAPSGVKVLSGDITVIK
ncbi:MAG: gliding motility-associated C-terminal domain-containing protein [Saprospiraceae bacterium]|nr:gliding motility-associated C-terminal domain-containing protein [Saprospiraceae bacterium]